MVAKDDSSCAKNVTKATEETSSLDEMTLLSPDFEPGPFDVICGRGNISRNHPGNKIFRNLIARFLPPYGAAVTKTEKSSVVSHIVDVVRAKTANDGGFVKIKNAKWYEVGDRLAREKVGQGFRESLHTKYKSSNESKKRRRKEELDRIDRLAEEFVQHHCTDLIKIFQDISLSPDSKTESGAEAIQSLFNKTQSELFERIKSIGKYNVDPIIAFSSNKKRAMENSLLVRKRIVKEKQESSSANKTDSEKYYKTPHGVLATTENQIKVEVEVEVEVEDELISTNEKRKKPIPNTIFSCASPSHSTQNGCQIIENGSFDNKKRKNN